MAPVDMELRWLRSPASLIPFRAPSHIPDFGSLPTYINRVKASPDPDTAVAQTVARMAAIIHASAVDRIVSSAAARATTRAGDSDRDRAAAIFWWIKARVTFTTDEARLRSALGIFTPEELLIEPARLLTMPKPSGDCDDFTMLVCSMLLASGIGCEIVTVAADARDPEHFSHVYPRAVFADGSRLTMDATPHGDRPGWEVPADCVYRRQVWPLFATTGLSGFGDTTATTLDFSQFGLTFDPTATTLDSQFGPTFDPTVADSISSGGWGGGAGIDWNKLLPGVFGATEKVILQTTLPAGSYQATGPGGVTQTYRVPAGSSALSIPPVNFGGSSLGMGTLLLLGGGALLLIMFMGKR